MTLTRDESMVIREAEEQRSLAMQMIDRQGDAVVIAQLLAGAGELYLEAASLLVVRAKREARAARPGKVTP